MLGDPNQRSHVKTWKASRRFDFWKCSLAQTLWQRGIFSYIGVVSGVHVRVYSVYCVYVYIYIYILYIYTYILYIYTYLRHINQYIVYMDAIHGWSRLLGVDVVCVPWLTRRIQPSGGTRMDSRVRLGSLHLWHLWVVLHQRSLRRQRGKTYSNDQWNALKSTKTTSAGIRQWGRAYVQ